jgi:hypothetical protein
MTGMEALAIAGIASAIAGGTTSIVQASRKPPKVTPQQTLQPQAPSILEDTKLKPGQKTNLINTSPQGVLSGDTASTGRNRLLGG